MLSEEKMDPITHAASGMLLGRYLKKRTDIKAPVILSTVSALLPDIDNLIKSSPEAYIQYHRSFTHSIFGGIILALIFAFIWSILIDRKSKLSKLALYSYFGIIIHIFLDYVTSYGTQIFTPLTNHRFTMESVFIIDPFYTVSFLILFGLTFLPQRLSRKISAAAVIWIFLYPTINLGIKSGFENYIEKSLTAKGISYEKVTLTTDFLSPLYWKLIVEDSGLLKAASFNVLHPDGKLNFKEFKKADREKLLSYADSEPFYGVYDWFTLYLAEERTKDTVKYYDLRFLLMTPAVKDRVKWRGIPFSLEAFLGKDGKPVKYIFHRPGAKEKNG